MVKKLYGGAGREYGGGGRICLKSVVWIFLNRLKKSATLLKKFHKETSLIMGNFLDVISSK